MTDWITLPIARRLVAFDQIFSDIYTRGGVVAGGFVRWMCSPRSHPFEAKDIDVFPTSEQNHARLKNWMERQDGWELFAENDICQTFISSVPGYKVQLIKPISRERVRTVGELTEILENFDFTVVRIGLASVHRALADPDFIEDEMARVLRIKNIHCPITSAGRVAKYTKKGYFCPPHQLAKLFDDWTNRDDDYKSRIIALFDTAEFRDLTEEEVVELEVLLRMS